MRGRRPNEFANRGFQPESECTARERILADVAKQKGLTVRLTAPFASRTGRTEFTAPEAFTKAAFALTPDDPLAGPIVGPTPFM